MKIAIVDDDEYWRGRIQQELAKYVDAEHVIDVYESGEQYIAGKKTYDISFVDIEMNGMDGFDTILKAREYQPDGIFVILTTHAEMCKKGYQVNAFRYIDKTELEDLEEAIRAAKVLLDRNRKINVDIVSAGMGRIALKNIIYIETVRPHIMLHTVNGDVKCHDKMQDIESELPEKSFIRCHNAFIVNLDKVSHIDGNKAYLSNGDKIEISQRKVWQVKRAYFKRHYECANK